MTRRFVKVEITLVDCPEDHPGGYRDAELARTSVAIPVDHGDVNAEIGEAAEQLIARGEHIFPTPKDERPPTKAAAGIATFDPDSPPF